MKNTYVRAPIDTATKRCRLAFVALFVVAGGAPVYPQPTLADIASRGTTGQANTATVFLYSNDSFRPSIFIDTAEIFRISQKRFLEILLPSGNHVFDSDRLPNKPLRLDLKPGEKHYLKLVRGWGGATLEQVSAEQAAKDTRKGWKPLDITVRAGEPLDLTAPSALHRQTVGTTDAANTVRGDQGQEQRVPAIPIPTVSRAQAPAQGAVPDLGEKLRNAATGGDIKAVEALLLQGADPNASNKSALTQNLCSAGQRGDRFRNDQPVGASMVLPPVDCFDYFADSTPLLEAVDQGHLAIVKLLLKAGATPARVGTDGLSPLMLAAARGYVSIVDELLAAGADPNHRSGEGVILQFSKKAPGELEVTRLRIHNALDGAIIQNNPVIFRALVAKGATPREDQQAGAEALAKRAQ